MNELKKQEETAEAQKAMEDSLPFLNEIPTLKNINNLQLQSEIKQDSFADTSKVLAARLSLLMKDYVGYLCSFKNSPYNNQKGFFGFYDYAQKWLKFKYEDENVYNDKLKELELDKPYKLAIELFQAYIKFRRKAKYARYQNGVSGDEYKSNIRDLFTDEDLIKLGGNKFIKDCYQKIGIKFSEDMAKQDEIKKKPQIQNINSRTGNALKSDKLAKDVKPNLYERVDNCLSWKIFKDGKVKNLTDNEISILKEAMKNESFWKHLGKTELQVLPFTGIAALMLGLIATFTFGATGGVLLALILTPIGAGALGIAPIAAPSSKKSAIVDNMINISNQNKEFNNNLKQGEEKYGQYKQNYPDFLKFLKPKSELEKQENIEKNIKNIIDINNIDLEQTNQITSKEGKSNEKIDPFNVISQNQNEQDSQKKPEEEKTEP